jgi:hypothetical protein
MPKSVRIAKFARKFEAALSRAVFGFATFCSIAGRFSAPMMGEIRAVSGQRLDQ